MKQKELEDELLALCLDFEKFRKSRDEIEEIGRTIRNVYTVQYPHLQKAQQELVNHLRIIELETDQAWRDSIKRVAERIHKAYTEVAGMRRDALVSSREIEAIELLERIHPHVDSAALREEIDEFMLADDEPEDPRETEGDLRMHDPEGKA